MSMFYELMMRKKTEIMYATIKGSLTENDGVFSGFSLANYLESQEVFDGEKALNGFELQIQFTTPSSMTNNEIVISIPFTSALQSGIRITTGLAIRWLISSSNAIGSANNFINLGQTYVARLVVANNTMFFYCGKVGETLTLIGSQQIVEDFSIANGYHINIGRTISSGSTYFTGSIDLNKSYIKLGSTKYNLQAVVGYIVVGSPTITDGVVSGFSSSNYLQIVPSSGDVNSIEIVTRIDNIAETISSTNLIVGSIGNLVFHLSVSTSKRFSFNYKDKDNTTRYISPTNTATNGYLKIKIKQDGCELYHSTDNITWNLLGSNSNHPYLTNAFTGIKFGYMTSTYNVFTGDLYIKDTLIKLNNKLWFNGQSAE